jgi:2-oxoglutarate ferredoxin oxidoreductase subunit alpha
MSDFVELAFDLAFKYRNPVMILSDGAIGQMMEKVKFRPQRKRSENAPDWATTGKTADRERNIITSLDLDPASMERHNMKLQEKYRNIQEKEVLFELIDCEDAELLFVAYGTSARICQKSVQLARSEGVKIGLIRPITLWPFPTEIIQKLAKQVIGILSVEMSTGQMVEDVRLAVEGKIPVEHYGRMGGIIPTPEELVEVIKRMFIEEEIT